MIDIPVVVKQDHARLKDKQATAGKVGQHRIRQVVLSFDDTWDDLQKSVVVTASSGRVFEPFTLVDNIIPILREYLDKEGTIVITLYGYRVVNGSTLEIWNTGNDLFLPVADSPLDTSTEEEPEYTSVVQEALSTIETLQNLEKTVETAEEIRQANDVTRPLYFYVTQAEYDALPQITKDNPKYIYEITDSDGEPTTFLKDLLEDAETAIQLVLQTNEDVQAQEIIRNQQITNIEERIGSSSIFVQTTQPVTTQSSYLWFETDISGNLETLWVETGVN